MSDQEAKQCPRCGSENLALLRTINEKRCSCSTGTPIPWDLEVGQKPVGYTVDPELTGAELKASITDRNERTAGINE